MSILRLEAVRREIGTFVILDDVSAAVAPGERVGLVGANGAGKTTLLRLCAGRDEPDAGRVVLRRGLSVGLLAQEANLDRAIGDAPSLRSAVRSGAMELERLEWELAALENAGAAGVQTEDYARLRARFESLEGYSLDQRVEEALSGLGFARDEWERPPIAMSGGEQTRASLARLVVSDPELLLLDEPTNHLDVRAIEWLETALGRRSRALLVASHDRAFLDAVVTRVWELRDRRLTSFRGAYSAYVVQREAHDARQRKEAEARQGEVERERELIATYRSHRKFGKMHEHERRLGALEPLSAPRRGPALALRSDALLGGGPLRSGDLVASIRDALLGFPPSPGGAGGTPILRVKRLEAQRGDRVGIVGPNGAGKTTLLRTVAGELVPLEGVARLGAAVQPGYLAQLRGRPLAGTTVLDALLGSAVVDNGPARSYLARFMFRGEDVFKPVSELSGGERSRLELALLGITPANLLLLDEPTNHLDIPAREALESFLREHPGTLLIVSHDRRLLETLADRLWVVEAGERPGEAGRAVTFDGGYREWRAAVADGWTTEWAPAGPARSPAVPAGPSTPRSAKPVASGTVGPTVPRGRPAPQGRLSKDAYRRQKDLVDADLTRLGLRKNHLELALGDPGVQANFVELRRLSSELADVDGALARAEDAWLVLEERAPR